MAISDVMQITENLGSVKTEEGLGEGAELWGVSGVGVLERQNWRLESSPEGTGGEQSLTHG